MLEEEYILRSSQTRRTDDNSIIVIIISVIFHFRCMPWVEQEQQRQVWQVGAAIPFVLLGVNTPHGNVMISKQPYRFFHIFRPSRPRD